jgi:hypothetical protein
MSIKSNTIEQYEKLANNSNKEETIKYFIDILILVLSLLYNNGIAILFLLFSSSFFGLLSSLFIVLFLFFIISLALFPLIFFFKIYRHVPPIIQLPKNEKEKYKEYKFGVLILLKSKK